MCSKKYKVSILMALMTVMAMCHTAQGQFIIRQADEEAALYNYAKAIPLYKQAYEKKPTAAAARGLASSYRKMNNYTAAVAWYGTLAAMRDHKAEDELSFAQSLISVGKYDSARLMIAGYLKAVPGEKTAVNMLSACDSALAWLAAPAVRGEFENLALLNSQWSDWSTGFSSGKIIFASDRPFDSLRAEKLFGNTDIVRKYYGWTGNSYLHLYEGNTLDSNSVRLMARAINGDYHSANASFTADGRKMYYAVTDLKKQSRTLLSKETPSTLHVEIMEQLLDTATGKWKQASPFPFNGIFRYAVGDPYITPDGTILYFVADYGDKGLGGTDIYYSRLDSGRWQQPVNMGPEINSAGNERTPFFDANGVLYFATDGRAGLGGLDIFRAVKVQDHWTAVNLGLPVNSAQDDFAPSAENTTLYFSSNRPGGKGSDDIYRFTPYRILLFTLSGTVTDQKTKAKIAGAEVVLASAETGKSVKALTDADGNYVFKLDSISSYDLSITKTGYNKVDGISVTTKGLIVSTDLHQDASLLAPDGGNTDGPGAKTFKLQNVYFELAKWDITPASRPELDKLVKVLKDNAQWRVEIATHTDSRSSDSYNMKLSQKRAEAIVTYLVTSGIAKERLVAKGYGETMLINRCANGVNCSEEEHQANRRTEFTILDK